MLGIALPMQRLQRLDADRRDGEPVFAVRLLCRFLEQRQRVGRLAALDEAATPAIWVDVVVRIRGDEFRIQRVELFDALGANEIDPQVVGRVAILLQIIAELPARRRKE